MFIITYKGKPLDIFAPNDLPQRTKNGISLKNIICFSSNSYIFFQTEQAAKDYILYIKKECSDINNIKRWAAVCPEVEKALTARINKLKIEEVKTNV